MCKSLRTNNKVIVNSSALAAVYYGRVKCATGYDQSGFKSVFAIPDSDFALCIDCAR